MKKIGYKKEFAGAVEAVASTGGSIMLRLWPRRVHHVRNAGVPYVRIILAAIIPALLYYFSVGHA
jgi:TRAP-type uncharacterized transport system fused permease subunit